MDFNAGEPAMQRNFFTEQAAMDYAEQQIATGDYFIVYDIEYKSVFEED